MVSDHELGDVYDVRVGFETVPQARKCIAAVRKAFWSEAT